MLLKINENGSTYSVTEVYQMKKYLHFIDKLSLSDYNALSSYVASVINSTDKFSLATHFSNPWPADLIPLWNLVKDSTQASYLLHQVVEEQLIADSITWLSTKTDITNRNFETNFYWRK